MSHWTAFILFLAQSSNMKWGLVLGVHWVNTNTNTNTWTFKFSIPIPIPILGWSDIQYQYQYQYLEIWIFNTNTNTNTGQNLNTSIPIPGIVRVWYRPIFSNIKQKLLGNRYTRANALTTNAGLSCTRELTSELLPSAMRLLRRV